MPALPQQEGKGQHKTQTNMSCINLTDMWHLSKTNNNFGIDQLKMSSNKPISMVDILNKKWLVAKLSEVFFRIYRTKKGDFWTELIRPPLAPMQ